MTKLPLLAFGFTIDDETFGFQFQLFYVSTFFSFQLFTHKILQLSAFSSWLLASFPAPTFFSSKIKKNRQKAKS